MKNFRLPLLLSLPLLCLGLRSANSAASAPAAPSVEGELLVGVRPASARFDQLSMIVSALGRVAGEQPQIHAYRVRLNRSVSMQYALERIRRHADVTYVEPNHVLQAVGTPNDPSWGSQYGPKKMQVDRAWDVYEPQAQTVVAVLDSGVDYNHSDLSSVLYRDANGTVIGYNAFNGSTNAADDQGHGTHCAGTVAARINNGVGVAGIAGWNPLQAGADDYVKIMPVKVLDSTGNGTDATVANGIIWAADHGAKVVSLSLGGAGSSTTIYNAINYAWGKGCVIVAAAGNSGVSTQFYPAAYPNVISVAATDGNDTLASFSNYGSWVKVAAPGVGIYSTYKGGGYASMNGTSMATPHVAGLAALLRSQSPNLSNSQVSSLITGNVDPYQPYSGRTLGASAGRVNAYRALLAARGTTTGPTPTAPAAPTNLKVTVNSTYNYLTWTGSTGAVTYTVKRSNTSGSGYATIGNGMTGTSYFDYTVSSGKTYYYVVSASNSAGESANSAQVTAGSTVATPAAPAAPTNLRATAGNGQAALTWTGSTGATSYTVKRSTASGTGYATVASGLTGTSYTNTGLTNGTTYYYVVTATNSGGESGNSAQASAAPQGASTSTLSAPTNLKATVTSYVYLTWNAVSGAVTYNVKRSSTSGTGFTTIATGLTGPTHFDFAVSKGATYYYVVTAVNVTGESAPSAPVSTGSNPTVPAAPAAPANLQATAGNGQVVLSWAASTGATGYNVKRSTTSGSGYASVASGAVSGTRFTDGSVANGTTYYYVVTAVNDGGESAGSSQVSATPAAPADSGLAAPTNLKVTVSSYVYITWNAVPGATTYTVKRSSTSGGGYTTIAKGLTGPTHFDFAVNKGNTYYYVVTAVNASGESAPSAEISATLK
jgi:subtilisin family serine protease